MEPLLSVKNLVKRFGGLTAVNQVSLDVFPGEVIGLVGDNGAGKSTLIKMVSGVYHPNDGEIYFEGKPVNIGNPSQARDMGIETIYQDLALAGNLSVTGNIYLGREHTRRQLGVLRFLDDKRMEQEAAGLLERLRIEIRSLRLAVEHLSGGQRQSVAIARATAFNARVIIMDEPTASLAVREVGKVLGLIKTLREHGVAVILISHRLQDVFAVSDRIMVLRHGQVAGDVPTAQATMDDVVGMMVGSRGGAWNEAKGVAAEG